MPRVIHFEINADDPDRATKFYEKAFGWQINKWEGPIDYWLVTTGDEKEPGINGGIMRRMEKAATVNTIDVPNLEEYMKKVEQAGGKIVTGKTAVPGVGYFAYCLDTEGNVFGIMQADASAA
ncbi:MAG: VOC family protein [Chloroflexi bacterium]|nr:VOC family protein [Chloroflexota bacterium]